MTHRINNTIFVAGGTNLSGVTLHVHAPMFVWECMHTANCINCGCGWDWCFHGKTGGCEVCAAAAPTMMKVNQNVFQFNPF